MLIAALVAAFAVMVTAMAGADPNPLPVGPHRHFVKNANGTLSQVGPDICAHPDDPGVQRAFLQFHANVHNAAFGNNGPAAPGLHNGKGAELVVMGGCPSTQ
jgi:hypothetical protein